MRPVRYLRGGRVEGLACYRPLLVMCRNPGCVATEHWSCRGHRASKCKPCASRYRRLVQEVAASGTARNTGFSYFLTLTAPGSNRHRRFIDPHDLHRGAGPRAACECWVGFDPAMWNPTAGSCWNRFRTALRREQPVEFIRTSELQRRGALHHHALLWSPKPLSWYQLQRLALAAGYGCSIDFKPAAPEHPHYLAKYVTKTVDERDGVPWEVQVVDQVTGEVLGRRDVPSTYRSWACSRGWGRSMAAVRAAYQVEARHWALLLRSLPAPRARDAVDVLLDALTPDELQGLSPG